MTTHSNAAKRSLPAQPKLAWKSDREFVEATGHPIPKTWTDDFREHRWDYPNQPIKMISWYDAEAYSKGQRM